jgi:hypothetical protein
MPKFIPKEKTPIYLMTKYTYNLEKIKLKINAKTPAGKWKEVVYHHKKIDETKYNVGIPCGSINNIFVLDIDIKDEGYSEFNKYIQEHGKPDTLTVKTPSGGTHYYFKLKNDDKKLSSFTNDNINYFIKQVCYTRSKIGGFGIDIRNNGGYIVAPPSSIDGVKYEIINETSINNISSELCSYLFKMDVNYKMNKQVQKDIFKNIDSLTESKDSLPLQDDSKQNLLNPHYIDNYKYEIDDAGIMKLLKMLEPEYVDNFEIWFKLTTILKGLNAKTVWKEWSKTSINYDPSKNKKYWNLASPFIDINYLIYILRNDGHKVAYVKNTKSTSL